MFAITGSDSLYGLIRSYCVHVHELASAVAHRDPSGEGKLSCYANFFLLKCVCISTPWRARRNTCLRLREHGCLAAVQTLFWWSGSFDVVCRRILTWTNWLILPPISASEKVFGHLRKHRVPVWPVSDQYHWYVCFFSLFKVSNFGSGSVICMDCSFNLSSVPYKIIRVRHTLLAQCLPRLKECLWI